MTPLPLSENERQLRAWEREIFDAQRFVSAAQSLGSADEQRVGRYELLVF
jgi:hypothetical protein